MTDFCPHGCYWDCEHRLVELPVMLAAQQRTVSQSMEARDETLAFIQQRSGALTRVPDPDSIPSWVLQRAAETIITEAQR
jgi:hypothetical protein